MAEKFRLSCVGKNVLMINPPVYDFSDFKGEYYQPTGLLRISSLLKKQGANVALIDCLEKMEVMGIHSICHRGVSTIPKYHYGMSFDELRNKLNDLPFMPDEVFLTSFATYSYESTRDTISLLRKTFPRIKIVVGGIYPTLTPEHAERFLGADQIAVGAIIGADEKMVDLNLYDKPLYLGLKPSTGCLNHCAYCAQKAINGDKMLYQDPKRVIEEIKYWYETKGIKQVYFFSDNFLYNKGHFQSVLYELIKLRIPVKVGAPKGMEPKLLKEELLLTMKEAGWNGIRLALETSSIRQRKNLERLHDNIKDYENAIQLVINAGFHASEIGTFILYGTPEEKLEEVRDTAKFISSLGSIIIPMAFTPVPKSKIFARYSTIIMQKDPTELMGRLYPFAEYNGYKFEDYLEIEKYFAELNHKTAKHHGCTVEPQAMSTQYTGIFAKSELSFAFGI